MNAPRVDRWGDPLEPIEDDDPTPDTTTRTAAEIRAHADELRRILRESRRKVMP